MTDFFGVFLIVGGTRRTGVPPLSRLATNHWSPPFESPIDAAESSDEIEVPVSAQHRKRVLAAESRNPNVIGRNRGSGSFEFTANGGIGGRCLLIYVQHPEIWKVFDKPVFVALPLARLLDTISVFA